MAAVLLRRALRVEAAERVVLCGSAGALRGSSQQHLPAVMTRCPWTRTPAAAASVRHYSSELKDDLRVRYLDGADQGELVRVNLY